jgi:hypothetical protein
MSHLVVPLRDKTLQATGDIVLRAELELLLRDSAGVWQFALFRVDSGAEMTTLPAFTARGLDLPLPQTPIPGLIHPTTGTEMRAGIIRAQVVGMDGTEYVFPCYFLGDPSAPTPAGQSSALSINLLGLTGVVNNIRLILDGTPTPGAPYGNLIVEKL